MATDCVCIKCKQSFSSDDEAAFDGEEFCLACKEANKEIAKKIDAQIAVRRANRQPANPVNVYAEARKKKKGTVTYFNL